ncbi:hypothetical protein [Cellulosimicrobium protaetiae]|uniref:Uncharacterized protein n=1 Tax=Cellulosimicrobium protaetiae TaxID=2587808 RepID=A0A6M5UNH0_9MICO|nr:hypothetical protein [Cellulosimicrobium protaetiae]QJW38761.1 hypothetical protein FIC82_020470 [Cellulosimicrobium protaetiae]
MADESSTSQALLILEALARVLESAEDGLTGIEDAKLHAGYTRAAAEAVMRDAGITAEQRKAAEEWGLNEWVNSLITILYPGEQVEARHAQLLQQQS